MSSADLIRRIQYLIFRVATAPRWEPRACETRAASPVPPQHEYPQGKWLPHSPPCTPCFIQLIWLPSSPNPANDSVAVNRFPGWSTDRVLCQAQLTTGYSLGTISCGPLLRTLLTSVDTSVNTRPMSSRGRSKRSHVLSPRSHRTRHLGSREPSCAAWPKTPLIATSRSIDWWKRFVKAPIRESS